MAMVEGIQPTVVKDNWAEILEANSEESRRMASGILDTYPRLRPFFLKAFRIFFKHFSRLGVEGLENLPVRGPFILAPNHESHLDNLFVACFLPKTMQRNMVVIGKKEHFDHLVTQVVAKLCHAIPVDRNNFQISLLQVCTQVLRLGGIILIHPEGTRSPDGRLLPYKSGISVLAINTGCPVVPVYIEGAYEFWPKNSLLPKSRNNISVRIGKPLYPEASSLQTEEFTSRLRMQTIALSQGRRGS